MKNYRILVPIALALLMIISVFSLNKNNKKIEEQYQSYLSKAREYAQKQIYDYAEEYYYKALEVKPSVDLYIESGVCKYDPSVENDNFNYMYDAIGWAEQIVEKYPKSAKAYKYLIDLNYKDNNYIECFRLYDTMVKKRLNLEGVNELISRIEYSFELKSEYSDVRDFGNGFCAVLRNNLWEYIDENGYAVFDIKFMSATDYLNGTAFVKDESENLYFIDREGKKCNVLPKDFKSTEIGLVGDEQLFVADNNNKYAYYSYETMEKVFGDYDEATTMFYSRAAIKDKDKWYIINTKGEKISDTGYGDIVRNQRGMICIGDRIFAKKGDKYVLLDKDGIEIGTDTYEDVDIFQDGTYAAVKQNGKWGYIDADGNKVIDCQYEEAKSFSNGIGAVKQNGKWGYINTDNKIVIESQFDEAKYLNSEGHAFVYSNGQWTLLSLYKYNH